MKTEYSVLDHGFVRLWQHMGDDAIIAACARTSLNNTLTPADEEKDRRLIHRLMRDRHSSPFEHVYMTFHVRCPVFVARQWFRTRFASYNEESGRYTELKDEYYTPDFLVKEVGKSMDYRREPLDTLLNMQLRGEIQEQYFTARKLYEKLLKSGVAKEQARLVLPVSQYTTFVWTVNALSLMNWIYLRTDAHAQGEIRAYAVPIESIFSELLPITHEAFRTYWDYGKGMFQ